ncbi:MAG: pilus assembly protein N-terminal domain-containing protein, partial [Acidobacteriia bacterium]|nr:pilus assembly protein N-terminal domain-containing protein [Terriglobia bacterium]
MAQQRRERREGLVRWVWLAGLVLLIMIAGDAFMLAAEGENVNLTVGRSMVLNTGSPIARVSLTSADVADAMVTSPNEVLINGKMPGTISMFVWDRAGAIRRYDVIVQRDIAGLGAQLKELFPGEKIDAQSNGKSIVLSGVVTTKDVVERAISVAAGYVDKRDDVVTLLRVQDVGMSNQVLLKVRFAEVSRSALTQLGASW